MIELKVDAREIGRIAQAYAIAGKQAPGAIARTLNWVGAKAKTQVGRALAKQTGLKYGVVSAQLRVYSATPGRLSYEIGASGKRLPLSLFAPRQTAAGISAAPWGNRRVFPGTFFIPGVPGHVFKREGKSRLPIEQLWGPSIAVEMVKGATAKAFAETVKTEIDARLGHELLRLFPNTK